VQKDLVRAGYASNYYVWNYWLPLVLHLDLELIDGRRLTVRYHKKGRLVQAATRRSHASTA
jgi:hypothetical protein